MQVPSYLKQIPVERTETPEEVTARISREADNARFKRWKDFIAFIFAVIAATAIGMVSVWIVLDPKFTPEAKTWATSILTGIVTGVVGFLTGKSLGKEGRLRLTDHIRSMA